jgi:hypothetical protein
LEAAEIIQFIRQRNKKLPSNGKSDKSKRGKNEEMKIYNSTTFSRQKFVLPSRILVLTSLLHIGIWVYKVTQARPVEQFSFGRKSKAPFYSCPFRYKMSPHKAIDRTQNLGFLSPGRLASDYVQATFIVVVVVVVAAVVVLIFLWPMPTFLLSNTKTMLIKSFYTQQHCYVSPIIPWRDLNPTMYCTTPPGHGQHPFRQNAGVQQAYVHVRQINKIKATAMSIKHEF